MSHHNLPKSGQRALKNILVSGGAGFIGSNFIRYLFGMGNLDPNAVAPFSGRIINVDLLTYAGNAESLADVHAKFKGRYFLEHADICDRAAMETIFKKYEVDTVVHFAAESHVDRSILGPEAFIKTNVMGTFTLLDVARNFWQDRNDVLFHHVSTDEVYGSLGETGFFYETTPYDPRSPYSSSKAASDHLVQAWLHTYGLPVTMSNCSNNYGPFQFPEKLIPVMILNMLEGKPLPVYGDGKNIRDWLFVEDHNSAVWTIMNKGATGECYNIGGENEWENIKLLQELISSVARQAGKSVDDLRRLITYVKDRPGHDRRYAINCDKLKNNLGWKQSVTFDQGLEKTVKWYLENGTWIEHVKSGAYRDWIKANYGGR
jgi:dTDP-glucose 4,6-dehydratase